MSRVFVSLVCTVGTLAVVACAAAPSGAPVSSVSPVALDSAGCAARAEPTALKLGPETGITEPKSKYRKEPIAAPHLPDGSVAVVAAIIGENGRPRHVCVAGGEPEWARAVAEALREWRFEPATLDGRPVAVQFTLTTKLRR